MSSRKYRPPERGLNEVINNAMTRVKMKNKGCASNSTVRDHHPWMTTHPRNEFGKALPSSKMCTHTPSPKSSDRERHKSLRWRSRRSIFSWADFLKHSRRRSSREFTLFRSHVLKWAESRHSPRPCAPIIRRPYAHASRALRGRDVAQVWLQNWGDDPEVILSEVSWVKRGRW